MPKDIKVGPDGTGSYRYTVNGRLSWHRYHNAASARRAARQPQRVVQGDNEIEYLAPVDSE